MQNIYKSVLRLSLSAILIGTAPGIVFAQTSSSCPPPSDQDPRTSSNTNADIGTHTYFNANGAANQIVTGHKWYTTETGSQTYPHTLTFNDLVYPGLWGSYYQGIQETPITIWVASVCTNVESAIRTPITFTPNVGAVTIRATDDPSNVCAGSNFSLSAEGTSMGPNYQWRFNSAGGTVISTASSISTDIITQSGRYYLTTTSNGQPTTVYRDVIIKPLPVATASNANTCSGATFHNPLSLSNQNQFSNIYYTWSYVNSTTVSGESPDNPSSDDTELTGTLTGSGTVTYHVTPHADGCLGNVKDVVMTVVPNVAIAMQIETNKGSLCTGEGIMLNVKTGTEQNTGSTPTFQWYVNDIPKTSDPHQRGPRYFTVDNWNYSNNAVVKCNVTSSLSCISNSNPFLSNAITIGLKPKENFTATVVLHPSRNPKNYCDGEIFFDAGTNYPAASYSWKKSSGSDIVGSDWIYHPSAGLFGTSDVASVTVVAQPNACLNDNSLVQTANTSGAGYTIFPPSVAGTIATSKTTYCRNESIVIIKNADHVGSVIAWQYKKKVGTGDWDLNWTTITSTLTSLNPPLLATSEIVQYQYQAVVQSGPCSSQATASITITVKPLPDASASDKTICSGDTTSVTITNPNQVAGTTFTWTSAQYDGSNVIGHAGSTSASSKISQQLTLGNTQGVVRYSITPNANGCVGTVKNIYVTVNPKPVLAITPQHCAICSGGTTALTLNSSLANSTLAWTTAASSGITGVSDDSGSTIGQTLSNSSTNTAGTATFTVIAAKNGCTDTLDAVVTVNPIPVASLSDSYIFSENTTSLSPGSSVSGSTYSWIPTSTNVIGAQSGSGTSIAHHLTSSAGGTVSYSITPTANTCTGSAITSLVTVYAQPQITAPVNYVIKENPLLLSTSVYDSYTWKNASDQILSTAATGTVSTPGSYRVIVTKSGATGTSIPFVVGGQLSAIDQNYVITNAVQVQGLKDPVLVNNSAVGKVAQTIQYFDGLGRPVQTVSTQASPATQGSLAGKDLVQAMAYDAFGREEFKYLPYQSGEGNGFFKVNALGAGDYGSSPQHNFYNDPTDKVADDASPFAKMIYENSPLGRVVKQGAPGAAWQPNNNQTDFSDHTVKKQYLLNSANEVLLWTYQPSTHLVSAKSGSNLVYYSAYDLMANKSYDEHNNIVIEYKDRTGKVILKRVQATTQQTPVNDVNYASTYYIYDDLDNLVTVLPPEAVTRLGTDYHSAVAADQEKFLVNWAFRYKYDVRHRMTEKKVPASGRLLMVYDNRDRLVMTQDGNQRNDNLKYWTFTKYDELNRPILTGIRDTAKADGSTFTQEEMQAFVDTFYAKTGAKYGEVYIGNAAGNILGYSNRTYPVTTNYLGTVSINRYLTATYYDNYDFKQLWTTDFNYANQSLSATSQNVTYTQPTAENLLVMGMVTGMNVKALESGVAGGSNWLRTATYYDDRYRVIQTISDNYKGGFDKNTTLSDFTGKILTATTVHSAMLAGTLTTNTVTRRMEYDHVGRLLKTWHKINSGTEILLAANEYNALGQLVDKGLHATASAPEAPKQSIDYRYNIRGWLTSINNPSLSPDIVNNDINDFFGMSLKYNDGVSLNLASSASSTDSLAVSYYKMNGNADDSGTLKKNASIFGATVTNDRFGTTSSAYAFIANNYIDIPNSELAHSFIQNTGKFTISAYIKITNLEDRNVIIGNTVAANGKGFALIYENMDETNGIHQLRLSTANGNGSTINTAKGAKYTINDTNWHHVAVVGDGKQIRFYVDGEPDGLSSPITLFSTGNGSLTTRIGNLRSTVGTTLMSMKGSVDEVKIFNKALTVHEVKALAAQSLGGAQFNGNIASMQWSNNLTLGEHKQNEYVFAYDAMNRLKSATYREGSVTQAVPSLTWALPKASPLMEGAISYDLNGNIKSLTRTDKTGKNMDVLNYDYGTGTLASNKLMIVSDLGDNKTGFTEDGNPTGDDYVYDNNGNLVFDRNKGGKDVAQNGSFDNGGTNWTLSGATTRIGFADSVANINATTTTTATLTQTGIIVPGQPYIVILDFDRTSAGGNLTVSVGGSSPSTSISNAGTGLKVVNITAGTGTDFKVNVTTSFAGKIRSIQVKGIVTISYNHLNLPQTVTKGNEAINYIYDATGRKLAQTVSKNGLINKRTDYAGEFFYENDTLKFINHEEGRVIMKTGTPEYQYHLKDHLGNVRMTFTTKREVEANTATLETANVISEQSQFVRYENVRRVKSTLFNHTTGGTSLYSERLSGGANEKYGLAKSLSVMPGDTVNVEVFAKYVDPSGTNSQALTDFLYAINHPGSAAPGTVVDGLAYSASTSSFAFGGLLNNSPSENAPKAYLNWIIFDRNFVFKDGGYVPVTTAAKENGSGGNHEPLRALINVKEAGYVYIYLSNENETPVEVFFDDFRVEHVKSPVVSMQDYYPFGLASQSYQRENSVPQNFLFNGKERQDELNLEWLDYGARMYMSDIARWSAVDPLSDKMTRFSVYNFAFDDPLRFHDPDGMAPAEANGEGNPAKPESVSNSQRAAQSVGASSSTTLLVAAKVRTEYLNKVSKLSPKDGPGRTAAKVEARSKTPAVVNQVLEKIRPMSGEPARTGGTANRSNPRFNSAGKVMGAVGAVGLATSVAVSSYNIVNSDNKPQAVMRESTAFTGAVVVGEAGAEAGGLLFSLPGAVIGGIGGAIVGGIVGDFIGEKTYEFATGNKL
jgi:RHS repeat-associated protein